MKVIYIYSILISFSKVCDGFVSPHNPRPYATVLKSSTITSEDEELRTLEKKKLLQLLRVTEPLEDPVLACPETKNSVIVNTKTSLLGSDFVPKVTYEVKSSNSTFVGSSDSFINFLEPVDRSDKEEEGEDRSESVQRQIFRNLVPLIPPNIRPALATAGLNIGEDYIPMRDLFTSPSVAYAYERGWRQGFARAGFPGADKEAAMAMEYFETPMARSTRRVLVDMSCATGLFTRRFAASGKYKRVLGCDYSASMLEEARRRIRTDPDLRKQKQTKLDLVRLDVGQIPMRDDSVDALHAGAAMHCWPDLPAATSEIYRVLTPGGRYFATTFLSSYFGTLQQAEGGANGPSRQAFQYFESVQQLRNLMESAGFESSKVFIEVLGNACVVIRCEK